MGKKRKATKPSVKKLRRSRIYEAAPATVALAELFAVVDDVMTEEDAFSAQHIKKSMGRINRQWKLTRAQLDPDFDPKRYPKRPRKRKKPKGTVRERLNLDGDDS